MTINVTELINCKKSQLCYLLKPSRCYHVMSHSWMTLLFDWQYKFESFHEFFNLTPGWPLWNLSSRGHTREHQTFDKLALLLIRVAQNFQTLKLEWMENFSTFLWLLTYGKKVNVSPSYALNQNILHFLFNLLTVKLYSCSFKLNIFWCKLLFSFTCIFTRNLLLKVS